MDKQNIWEKLKQASLTNRDNTNQLDFPSHIFALAPMEDVTDTVFRQVILKTARPDVFFTEFMSVEGFMSDKGRNQVNKRLIHTAKERPLIAQIWGITPKYFEETAKELAKLGLDGIDINMGCPQKKIIKNGGCARMIGNYALAKDVISATKQGAQGLIPVSVKTRLGTNHKITEEWGTFLLEQGLDELTIHGRIAKDMSIPPADWSEIKKIVDLRNKISPNTVILGNGDVSSYKDALERVKLSRADGVMVGRGIFKNPWLFNKEIDPEKVPIDEKLELLRFHIDLYEKTWGNRKPLHNLRHYFKIYLSGFEGAGQLRERLMECESYEDLRAALQLHLHTDL